MKKNVTLLVAMWKAGISQADLARAANISSEARLSRIVNNRAKPTPEEVRKMSEVLKCNLSFENESEAAHD